MMVTWSYMVSYPRNPCTAKGVHLTQSDEQKKRTHLAPWMQDSKPGRSEAGQRVPWSGEQ